MSDPSVEDIVARMEAGWTLTSSESRVIAAEMDRRGTVIERLEAQNAELVAALREIAEAQRQRVLS